MSDEKANTYDEVPYESFPIRQSHPNQIATVALLTGMTPPPVDRCRVLELGCAGGGNIIPMALAFPECEVVGVDLSSRQIADGQAIVDELGLSNIELKHASILDVDESYGEFDYILCHGVYSWVPAEVQEKILDVSYKNLTDNGVAYISYNTYPGWHMRDMVRNMMRYHTQVFDDPTMKVRQARALLDFLAKAVPGENSPYGLRLRQELDWLKKKADHYLYHEHLEEVNEPEYFHGFIERAQQHGLQYVGEAIYNQSAAGAVGLPTEVQQTLRRVTSDIVRTEQYLDFVRNRTFRQTLLCKQEVTLTRTITPETLMQLYVSCPARMQGQQAPLSSQRPGEFVNPDGTKLSTQAPLLKAAIAVLGEMWPGSVTIPELWDKAHAKLNEESQGGASTPQPGESSVQELALRLYKCYVSNFAQLALAQPQFVVEVSDRPTAFSLARYQARQNTNRVTNLKHEVIVMPVLQREILKRLDGDRDRDRVVEELVELNLAGDVVLQREGEIAGDRSSVASVVENRLDQSLRYFATNALLVG